MTRGEPRPVHITLIAASGCRVYNSVVVIRGITPRLSPGYETRQTVESTFFQSRGTWAVAVVRLSRPRSTEPGDMYTTIYHIRLSLALVEAVLKKLARGK